jgi:GH15 family glucan-1,4-alpha-glucosidase
MSVQDSRPQRCDGYAPIGSYAVLGDGRTVALVARDGAVDWFPMSGLDGHPTFAGVLDPERGGSVRLAPAGPFTVEREYVERSNVLRTTFRTDEGSVRVTDSLNVGRAGRLPWTELARRVEVLDGSVLLRWSVEPGSAIGPAQPWAWLQDGRPMIDVAGDQLTVNTANLGDPVVTGHAVQGEARLQAGDRGLLALVGAHGEPVFQPSCEHIDTRIDKSVEDWQRWCDGITYDGRWSDAVRRSALALKLLIHAPTGAIAGAGTTSLPEAIGGKRNFDYRFAWIRDASFAIDALAFLDAHEEVHAALSWLLHTVSTTAPDLRVFYRLDGSIPTADEDELPVRGYRETRPAVAGNSAELQTQLGCFGDLADAVYRFVQHGAVLDGPSSRLLSDLADRVCDIWAQRDAGIWELGGYEHYTISKMSCWVALDRIVRLADNGQLSGLHAERWRHEAQRIHDWVDENCWSDEKQAYTFYAGSEELDASVLLAARTGFCEPDSARLNSTIDAITAELGEGPLLYRYSSVRGKEGCFLACCFWRVQALTYVGRRDEAADLMDQLVALTNDVGLLSEEMTPEHELRGNIPQALSHLSLITAAAGLA